MNKKLYVMDSCGCLSKHKPKIEKGFRDTYKCYKCSINSLGYDEWNV